MSNLPALLRAVHAPRPRIRFLRFETLWNGQRRERAHWVCKAGFGPVGCGKTPREAYLVWALHVLQAWRDPAEHECLRYRRPASAIHDRRAVAYAPSQPRTPARKPSWRDGLLRYLGPLTPWG